MMLRYALLVALLPALIGCAPDGPPEFYRSALQARSEYVDALSRVVDEETAKVQFKKSEKVFNERMKDIKEGLERVKFDGSFGRLRRGNFELKHLDANDRVSMIEGIRAYASYCKNIVFTNLRLKRELQRLQMVLNLEVAAKAKAQIDSNQPVSISAANFPNLNAIFPAVAKSANADLRFVPRSTTKEDLAKLEHGVPDEDVELILNFQADNLDGKVAGMEPPATPQYPQWAIDVDRRAGGGLLPKFEGFKKDDKK